MYCSARINPSVLQVSTRIGFIAKQRMSVVTKPRTYCYHKWFNLPLKRFSAYFLSFCWLTEIRVWHCLSRTTSKRSFIKSTSYQNQQVTIQQLKIWTHPPLTVYSVLEALIPCQLTAFEHKQPLGHFQTLNLMSWRVFLRLFYLTSGQMQPRGTVKCKWVEKFPHVQIYLRVENFENEVGLS